jgi:hypothetical protein
MAVTTVVHLNESSMRAIRRDDKIGARINVILQRYADIMQDHNSFTGYLLSPEVDRIRSAVAAFDHRGGGTTAALRSQVAAAVASMGSTALADTVKQMPLARFVALIEHVERVPERTI